MLPVALAKLQAQYRGSMPRDAPKAPDDDVFKLDAVQPTIKLVEQVTGHVLSSLLS
jgi:hypothetical protein